MGRKKMNLTEQENTALENFELPKQEETKDVSEILNEITKDETPVPSRIDPDWSDYVISQLAPDEIYDGKPTTDGLRRLVELLVGRILVSRVNVKECTRLSENGTLTPVTVEYEVIVFDEALGKQVHYSDAAQVCHYNTKPEFLRYGVETASTRAEGRVYRKLLKLKKTVTSEEADAPPINEEEMSGNIREEQKNFLDILCRRNDINLIKYINSGSVKHKSIDNVTYEKAAEMVRFLSKLEQNPSLVKDEIRGYDSEWRNRAF